MPATSTDPRIGLRLGGRYLLQRCLGQGGMAMVYAGRDEVLGREVAIKLLHPGLSHDPSLLQRFRQEAKSSAGLTHPNIVTTFDSGSSDDHLFIVMELVDGLTVRQLLDRFGHLDTPTTRHIVASVAAALDHAHARGIVHRDIKPENVLVTPHGDVKVVDFGIAKALSGQHLTVDRPLGTVAYVAPEQLRGTGVDARSDVYALGAMAYEMLTGRSPSTGDTPQATAVARLRDPVLSAGISPDIDGAIARATASDPTHRFGTAGAFAATLGPNGQATFSADTAGLPTEPAADGTSFLPLQTRIRRALRRRTVTVLAAVGVLVVAAVAAYLVLPSSAPVPDLTGQTLAQAEAALTEAGLELGPTNQVFHDVAPPGTVVGTDPAFGQEARRGALVTVAVSRGPELFVVPDVVGLPLDEARALLEEAGFSIGGTEEAFHDEIAEGSVAGLDPDDRNAKQGTAFTVFISQGPELAEVPDLAGRTSAEAETALTEAGFTFASTEVFSDTVATGKVVSTTPAAGTETKRGTEVTARVSKGPQPIEMPDLVGMQLADARAKATSLGLVVKSESPVPGTGAPDGEVQGQNPTAGTTVHKGAAINLWYAQG